MPVTGGVVSKGEIWPSLPLDAWRDTYATLHMWTQIIGKVRLALAPMVNHWWQVTLYVTARGLTTSLMPPGRSGVEIEVDFIDHLLVIRTTDGETRHVRLEPRPVASLHQAAIAAPADVGVSVF